MSFGVNEVNPPVSAEQKLAEMVNNPSRLKLHEQLKDVTEEEWAIWNGLPAVSAEQVLDEVLADRSRKLLHKQFKDITEENWLEWEWAARPTTGILSGGKHVSKWSGR